MKEGWKYLKLGEVCDVLNGYAFKSTEYVDNGIRVMRITNVQKGAVIDDDPKYYPLEKQTELRKYLLVEGDLLMSLTGNVGRVGLLPADLLPAGLNQRVACIRIKGDSLNKKFLFHLLNSDIFESECIYNAAGIAQKNMSTEWLKDYTIPVPPLTEQQRIVSELDLLSSIIDKQKAQLKELDTLCQSIFYDMFGDPVENEKGWEVKKLGEISKVKTGPFGSMLHKEDYITGGIPLVNPIHMRDYAVHVDVDFTISEEKADELKDYLLEENDVIFARRGDIGRCAVITENENGFLCGTGSLFVRFEEEISPVYVLYTVKEESFKQLLLSKAKGATMLNLNSGIIAELKIAYPPLPLQHLFAQKIQAIESQKAAISSSLAETQKLFDYTMDKYFG